MVGLIAFGRPDNSVISPKVFKSMFKATYYTFCTLTTPATLTRSMGLPADARAVKSFAATLFKSTLTWQLRSIYRDLQKTRQPRHCRQLILTTGPLGVRVCVTPHAVFVREFILTIIFRVYYYDSCPSYPNFTLTWQLSLTYRDLDLGTVFWYRDKSCSSTRIKKTPAPNSKEKISSWQSYIYLVLNFLLNKFI